MKSQRVHPVKSVKNLHSESASMATAKLREFRFNRTTSGKREQYTKISFDSSQQKRKRLSKAREQWFANSLSCRNIYYLNVLLEIMHKCFCVLRFFGIFYLPRIF